jgi:hypothetical protein
VHTPTGFVWAVQLRGGEVICAAGPLLASEADPELLAYLDYSIRDALWVQERRDEFVRRPGQD